MIISFGLNSFSFQWSDEEVQQPFFIVFAPTTKNVGVPECYCLKNIYDKYGWSYMNKKKSIEKYK
jgi:hypothetical protein